MHIQVLHREEWCDIEGNYVPTDEIIGYRAWSDDGKCFGYGETVQEAEDCLRRILWRVDTTGFTVRLLLHKIGDVLAVDLRKPL